MSENTSTKWTRSQKIRAVLAGGVVLGVGAAVTLAAWNDSEFAQGDFTAGSFNLEGSLDNLTYTEHDTAGTAAVVFDATTGNGGNMSPDDVVYQAYWVRLDAPTTSDATMVLDTTTNTATGTNAPNLSYSVYELAPAATCDATTVATAPVVGSGTSLTDRTAGTTVNLTANAAGTPGDAVQLCFEVTAAAEGTLIEGGPASTVWGFQATSVSDY